MNCKPYLRAHADELLESLAALIRIPSVEGTPEEDAPYGREVARCLQEALAQYVGEDGAQTLLLYTLAHTQAAQTREQALSLGAQIAGDHGEDNLTGAFTRGLEIILRGIGE